MGVIDFEEYLQAAIQAGNAVEGNVVRVIADNGDEIGEAVFKVIQGGNGSAEEVGIAVQTGGGSAIATGLAFLSMSVPTVVAAIAPALGIVAGIGLYQYKPEFWNNLSAKLVESGQTVRGRCIAYWSDKLHLSETTIEIVKQALVEEGAFTMGDFEPPAGLDISPINSPVHSERLFRIYTTTPNSGYSYESVSGHMAICTLEMGAQRNFLVIWSSKNFNDLVGYNGPLLYPRAYDVRSANDYTYNNKTAYWYSNNVTVRISDLDHLLGNYNVYSDVEEILSIEEVERVAWTLEYGEESGEGVPLQEDATYPNAADNFTTTFPSWLKYEYDQRLPDPSELPKIYPIKYPEVDPIPYPDQEEAQDPEPESPPEIYPVIGPDFNIPDPIPDPPEPEPEPEPDPDPQPEPDPIPEPGEPIVPSDPVDPNIPPSPSVPIVIPPLPDTVNSSKLFTVYNPTASQLDALGGYLWDSSIIAAIRDIWQEPMDGLISLQQIFVTPPSGGSHNIILGFLDSGVPSAVVSNQFVTIDCGTVSIPEDKGNCTDYAPYTSLHLYLPFIGIVELDTNECMNSDISIKYKVDVYTGTCLAQVSVEREADMPNDPILYTFSGNCSQQIPLTSGNATGMLSALVGAISTGISVASGGGLSTLAGAQLLGNSLTHEMMHVSHSGNISANAGIMGQKKPYLIIGRRHNYDANAYNSYYGFPANKTVVLGNHSGFVRMKSGYVKTSAMKEEYEEIMRLLEDGVFL